MKIFLMVTELWRVQEVLEKTDQRGIITLETKNNQWLLSSVVYKNVYGWTDRQKDRQRKSYNTTVFSKQEYKNSHNYTHISP